MSKTYKSKPNTIEAFRFTNKDRDFPDWFIKAIHDGRASVTRNKNEQCITIYGDNQMEKAYLDDFVCLSQWGKIYKLDDETFKQCYEVE